MTINLAINPSLDLTPYREEFARTGIVQVRDFLTDSAAEDLHALLKSGLKWRTLFVEEGKGPVHYSDEELAAMGQQGLQAKFAELNEQARRNVGYLYRTYPMIEAYLNRWDPGHNIHKVSEFLNSPDFLSVGGALLARPDIVKAEAHATKFSPGHYLTRHMDAREDGTRRAAYVLGLTKDWQPDWGGMLMFLKDDIDIECGFLPKFNVLTVFDISKHHTVSQVSTFAGGDRYSVTGWFRSAG
ncbi:MAG: 2OG-Fe(II) oxygenase family protein [Pseudomonadota bacterium]